MVIIICVSTTLTRRRAAALTVAALTLTVAAGCGGDDADDPGASTPAATAAAVSSTTPSEPAGGRTVSTPYGEVTVPADPGRIVALDEYAAMTLLSIGVTPAVVYRSLSSDVGAAVFASLGIEVIDAPTMILDPNFEEMAAQHPDLLVMIDTGTLTDTFGSYQQVAPTLVLPYEQPWRDGLALAGQAFGAEDAADRVTGRLEARLAEAAADVPDGSTVSIIGSFGGELIALAPVNPISLLLDEVGIGRPAAEADADAPTGGSTSAIPFSAETLSEHDADWVAVLGESYYDAGAVTSLPTLSALSAAGTDHLAVVNGEMWTGSFPFAVWWVLDDLDGLIASDRPPATAADTSARWQEFLAATS